MDGIITQFLSALLEAGEFLSWGIVYLIWNQSQMRRELENWKGQVEKRLTILETLNPDIKP